MGGWERIAALFLVRVGVVNIQDAADGLLLKPLAGIAGVDACAASEGAVEGQAVSQVHANEVNCAEGGVEKPASEGFGLGLVVR